MKIINCTKGIVLGDRCEKAVTFLSRLVGLMGRKEFATGKGLILEPCNSIHMFFMSFPIDVVFTDRNNRVVYLINNIKPWKVSPVIKGAQKVIELPSGTIQDSCTSIGDVLEYYAS